jgi:hypothetical protein
MSRSNPNANAPNPATRWFEWSGETGSVRYYDKDLKENIICPLPFTFLLLDELSSVRGWHEASKSGITSNQVRDTREELLVVRAFKGGTLAEGLYNAIKDRIKVAGGKFVTNCYLGFKHGDKLVMGCLQFKGAALGAWMEFRKNHRSELFTKAVTITGATEGKKGRIVYKMPTFALKDLAPSTNSEAIGLDRQLQAYLAEYLSRATHDRVDETVDAPLDEHEDTTPIPDVDLVVGDDVPF